MWIFFQLLVDVKAKANALQDYVKTRYWGVFFPRLAVFFKEKSVSISGAYITDLAGHFLGEKSTQSPYDTLQEKVIFSHSYTSSYKLFVS